MVKEWFPVIKTKAVAWDPAASGFWGFLNTFQLNLPTETPENQICVHARIITVSYVWIMLRFDFC